MEASEARKIAIKAHAIPPDRSADMADVQAKVFEHLGSVAAAGSLQTEFDITPFHLSPGNESLLITTLRDKGYSVHPRGVSWGRGGVILDIAW